jgi:hypothetical protein
VTPDPATAAARLLADYEERYGVPRTPPIPIDEIARAHLLLWVELADDLRLVPGAPGAAGRLSGLLIPSERTIWVDRHEAERSAGRRRFTTAHEVGHWVLHAQGSAAGDSVFCRPNDLHRTDHLEGEANAFAASLLMPEPLLRPAADASGCNIAHLAQRFDVSAPAMKLRLLRLDLLPPWMRA